MRILKKAVCMISSLLIGVSVFFPYISMTVLGSTVSASLIDSTDGIILIILAAAGLICALAEMYIPSFVIGIAAFIFFLIENNHVVSTLNTGNSFTTSLARSLLSNGPGYYLLLFGSLALILFSILGILGKRNSPSSR